MKTSNWPSLFFCLTSFNKRNNQTNHPTLCISSAQFPSLVHNKPHKHLCRRGLKHIAVAGLILSVAMLKYYQLQMFTKFSFHYFYFLFKSVNHRRYAALFFILPQAVRKQERGYMGDSYERCGASQWVSKTSQLLCASF